MLRNMLGSRWTAAGVAAMALQLAACQMPAGGLGGGGSGASGSAAPAATASAASAGLPQGYTCCNLHYEGDWISDSNYPALPMIPLGTPARATGYGRFRVAVDLNGKPMRLGIDYGRAEPLEAYAAKLIVPEDPKRKLATYPAGIQRAITDGKVMIGMTREQVIMAIGYPQTDENPTLSAPFWRYWVDSFNEYQVYWDGNGRVKELTGTVSALARIQVK